MTVLNDIPIRGEPGLGERLSWGNASLLLQEVLHGLQRLVDVGEPTVIDLLSIPMGPGDREVLFNQLGQGEVTAVISAMGESRVQESEFPGVWIVEHKNPDDQLIALQLEITAVPRILQSQVEDIEESRLRLKQKLQRDEKTASTD